MPKISMLTQALNRVPTTAYIVSGAVVLLWGAWQANNYHQREVGRRDLLIAQAEQTNADLRHQADSLSKVYRTDTLRLTKIRRVTDSLTVTVDQWKTDTLKVVEYVVKADSTIAACMDALSTCETRVAIAQKGWKLARDELALVKALPTPNWLQRHTAASVGLGATYGQHGKVAVGPTVSFGFRFFP